MQPNTHESAQQAGQPELVQTGQAPHAASAQATRRSSSTQAAALPLQRRDSQVQTAAIAQQPPREPPVEQQSARAAVQLTEAAASALAHAAAQVLPNST